MLLWLLPHNETQLPLSRSPQYVYPGEATVEAWRGFRLSTTVSADWPIREKSRSRRRVLKLKSVVEERRAHTLPPQTPVTRKKKIGMLSVSRTYLYRPRYDADLIQISESSSEAQYSKFECYWVTEHYVAFSTDRKF
jgi:hypothetical protein